MHDYIGLKFAHIVIAIASLGGGAALAILIGFFAAHPVHGGYVLRTARKLAYLVVVPGYVLMLVTGMWMGHLANLLDARWTEAAMNLWGVGGLFIAFSLVVLHRQIRLFEAESPDSPAFRRAANVGRLLRAGAGLVVLVIIYFMVFKPGG